MAILLDTNIIILNEKAGRIDLIADVYAEAQAYMAAISVSELLVGVHLAIDPNQKVKRLAFVEGVFDKIPVIEFNTEIARIYADLYAYFCRSSKKSSPGAHDLMIAATAVRYDHVVLTYNVKDFKKIPGVKVETPPKN